MGVLSQQHTWCDAIIVQAVSNVLNVTILINESIEGWAPVTVISPTSGQKGTNVNIGHLDERHYVSALQLDYYNDSISGYEISGVTNVNNYIHQIFSLARDWSKRVTWANIPQLKLGNIRGYSPMIFPNF